MQAVGKEQFGFNSNFRRTFLLDFARQKQASSLFRTFYLYPYNDSGIRPESSSVAESASEAEGPRGSAKRSGYTGPFTNHEQRQTPPLFLVTGWRSASCREFFKIISKKFEAAGFPCKLANLICAMALTPRRDSKLVRLFLLYLFLCRIPFRLGLLRSILWFLGRLQAKLLAYTYEFCQCLVGLAQTGQIFFQDSDLVFEG